VFKLKATELGTIVAPPVTITFVVSNVNSFFVTLALASTLTITFFIARVSGFLVILVVAPPLIVKVPSPKAN